MIKKLPSIIFFILFFSSLAYSQDRIELTKIDLPIVLDGDANEPAWEAVPYYEPVQYEPLFMGTMNEITKFKVAYDDNFVYVSGELFTKDPNSITTNSLARDKYSSDDVFAIIIDGFNDNQNASWFFTNPDGVRFDFAVSNDANFSGGRNAINSSWNTFWDVETVRNEKGWFAEMRIPFSSIGVQINENNQTEMGIIVYRWITTKNERHIFPAIPPNWNLGNAKPSQAQDVVLNGVKSKNPIYITPYGLAGVNRLATLSGDSTEYFFDDEITTELGFDLKYNVTDNLTLDLTVNTDFAQVEADDQQLNLSRFSLFFPEKRQFFQQRSGLFDFSFGRDQVFYSRRIGLDGDGNPVRILGGGRITGRVGNLDVGFINMQTADSDNLPSENFGVLRLKQQAINENSYFGGIFTSKLGADGSSNIVYGLDGEINTFGQNFIEFRAAQSIDDELDSSMKYDLNETTALRISLRNANNTGFSYQATVNRLSDEYNPSLGFVRIGGTFQKFLRLSYGWLGDEESIFRRNSFRIFYFGRFYNDQYKYFNFNDGILSRTVSSQWNGNFKQLGSLSAELNYEKEDIPTGESFDLLGKIHVPSGQYDTYTVELSYQLSEAWKVAGDINTSFGSFYDGDIKELSVNPRFFLSRKLELGGSYRVTNLLFPNEIDRNTTDFTSHLGQFRASYSFNKKATVSTFVQYSNVAEIAGANFRFRYNFSEGRDFWLVINEQVNTSRSQVEAGLPNLPQFQSGSILIKYNHTFIF
ncbi:MAG: hypothetical protein BalsKO_09840 [Balneolaceae bacterium]